MKNADLIIRTQRMLPEVYSDESRDFLVFTRLADAVYNSCKFNIDLIRNISDARYINDRLLKLLADKFGLDLTDVDLLKDDEIRIILRCLPYLIKYKGSYKAVEGLVNMYFKIYHISGAYELSITNEGAVVLGITLSGHTIILGIESILQSTTLLLIMAKYLLPPGYSFFVYFFTRAESYNSLYEQENITLLFQSDSLNSIIDLEIPDFIWDAEYSWIENTTADTRDARVNELISAIDAHQIADIYENFDPTFFLGFVKEINIPQIVSNFINSTEYDSQRDPILFPKNPNLYEVLDVVLAEEGGEQCHKILMTENRLYQKAKYKFNTYSDIATRYNENAEPFSNLLTYNKDDLCIYNNALYKALTNITMPEEWVEGHWSLLIRDNETIEILADETRSKKRAFYQYQLSNNKGKIVFLTFYPTVFYWKTILLGALAIVDTVTETNENRREVGDIHYITIEDGKCKFNKMRSKGGYGVVDPLNPTASLPTEDLRDFDYCCLMNKKELPFYYKTAKSKEIILNQKDAVLELPILVKTNDLRYKLADSFYYRGLKDITSELNMMDKTKFKPSYSISGVNFINNEDGSYLVDGVCTGGADFIVLEEIELKKDCVYALLGCPSGGDLYGYALQTDSSAFNEKLYETKTATKAGTYKVSIPTTAVTLKNIFFDPETEEFYDIKITRSSEIIYTDFEEDGLSIKNVKKSDKIEYGYIILHNLVDYGGAAILKARQDDPSAKVTIRIADKAEVTYLKFIPELYNLTECLGITKELTIDELREVLWSKVKEGPFLQDQYLNVEDLRLEDNTVVWKRGGDYYIWRKNTQGELLPFKYTKPLFFMKLMQIRDEGNN